MFSIMFKSASTRRVLRTSVVLLAWLPAWALAGPHPSAYGNELERCITSLREQINVPAARQVRYLVSDIERRGAWYRFAIRSELYDAPDGQMLDAVETTCRAHRFNMTTEISL